MPVSAEVATLFLDELARRNIEINIDEDGNYSLRDDSGMRLTISLENLSRDFQRDRDPGRIVTFVDTITNFPMQPDWEQAESRIRWQFEPSDHKFGNTLRTEVSDKVALVLVYVDPSETQIRWLSEDDAKAWDKSREDLMRSAQKNMNQILMQTKVEASAVAEFQLGMLNNELIAFKAALLACPELKRVVEPVIGWPLFAVMPCRDFVYVINQKAQELLGRMGNVVMNEYQQSGYPISTEVFEITDDGLRAIGDFQQAPADPAPEQDDEDMKTIRYRGGVVTFRIPSFWEEEYEEEGGGTFYDEDGEGTLRLNVLTLASKSPVNSGSAMSVLEGHRKEYQGELVDLGQGNALLRYAITAEEDDEELTIYYWEIAHVSPPNQIRLALFSYTCRTAIIEDPDIVDEVEMLNAELHECQFA